MRTTPVAEQPTVSLRQRPRRPAPSAVTMIRRNKPAAYARESLRSHLLRLSWSLFTGGVLVAFSLFFLVPVLWILLSSFRYPVDTNAIPPVWFFTPVLDQYASIFGHDPIWRGLLNSAVAVGGSVSISTVIGVTAAYGISRMERGGRRVTSFLFLFYRMMPLVVLAVPLYQIYKSTGLYDTRLGLVLAYTNISLPVVVWFMVDFFNALPVELEEASMLDGCSRLQHFLYVALPLVAPGLVTAVILSTALAWSDFLLAVALTGPNSKTLTVELRGAGGRQSAISVVTLLPLFVLAMLIQKRFVQGLTWGAVKE